MTLALLYLKSEFLDENFYDVINLINNFHSEQKEFKAVDLMKEQNYYYRYMLKGNLQLLLAMNYIEIVSTSNGYKNFIYRSRKEIIFEK